MGVINRLNPLTPLYYNGQATTPEALDLFGATNNLWNADHQISPYDAWWCQIGYFLDSGMLQIPVSAPNALPQAPQQNQGGNQQLQQNPGGVPGQGTVPLFPEPQDLTTPPLLSQRTACQVVQVAAPYGYKVVEFAAERTGDWPKIPHPLTNDFNSYLAATALSLNPPALDDAGQSHGFRVSGWHAYILGVPYWCLDNLVAGLTAYDVMGQATGNQNPQGGGPILGPWTFPARYLFYLDGSPISP
jgi:hypothetical protein